MLELEDNRGIGREDKVRQSWLAGEPMGSRGLAPQEETHNPLGTTHILSTGFIRGCQF